LKRYSLGKTLLLATVIYTVLTVVIYLVFNSMIPSVLKMVGP